MNISRPKQPNKSNHLDFFVRKCKERRCSMAAVANKQAAATAATRTQSSHPIHHQQWQQQPVKLRIEWQKRKSESRPLLPDQNGN
jgi:hypothetical protein